MRLLFLVCGCFPGWLGVTFIERGFVGGQQLALTPSAWEESAVEALKSHASQLFGCSMLGADKRGGLWHVNGCGDGLFVEVTRFKTSAGSELVHDSTHFFFDLASEDPAAAFAEMQRLAPEGQWQVQGTATPDVMSTLARLVAVNSEGARQLSCARAAVEHHFVRMKELTFTVVEGCHHRMTFFGEAPPHWHLMTDVPI